MTEYNDIPETGLEKLIADARSANPNPKPTPVPVMDEEVMDEIMKELDTTVVKKERVVRHKVTSPIRRKPYAKLNLKTIKPNTRTFY